MGKVQIIPKFRTKFPLIMVNLSDFVNRRYGANVWRDRSGIKTKLGLSDDEFSVCTESVATYLILFESFGFDFIGKLIKKHGSIQSLVLGIGYAKTIHLRGGGKKTLDIIKPSSTTKLDQKTLNLYTKIREKFADYLKKKGIEKENEEKKNREREIWISRKKWIWRKRSICKKMKRTKILIKWI